MGTTVLPINEVQVDLRADTVRDIIDRDGLTQRAWCQAHAFNENTLNALLGGTRPCTWKMLLRLAGLLRVEPTTIADVYPVQRAA